MLSLHSPDRWIWLLAAVPIVAFYLLKTRLRRRTVATLSFWEQVFPQRRSQSLWHRLQHVGSLLLQLAFLALVVGALLDPVGAWQKKTSQQIILVLDNSASMQAIDAAGPRWQAAIASAQREVRAMRTGDEMAIVSAGGTAQVVLGLTDFGPSIRDAVAALEPTDGPTRIDEALRTARQLAPDPERRQIVLISDGCFSSQVDQLIASAADVRVLPIGQPIANVAITRFQARRSLIDPTGYAVLIEVQHFADASDPLECRLTLELNDRLVDVQTLRLAAGEAWRKTLHDADADGGVLTARLDVVDALATDNRAAAILPQHQTVPVNLVSDANTVFLQSALEAIPSVEVTTSISPIVPPPPRGLTVCYRTVPETLPEGPLMFIDPQADSPFWKLGAPLPDSTTAQQTAEHPVLSHVQLTNMALPGGRHLEMAQDHTALVTASSGELLMASLLEPRAASPPRRILVLSTRLDESDLPLRIAFPILMANAVNWLSNDIGELQPALSTGQVALLRTGTESPDAPAQWILHGPLERTGEVGLSQTWPLLLDRQGLSVGPLWQQGIYRFGPRTAEASSRPMQRLAVNLTNAEESDLRPRFTSLTTAAPRQWVEQHAVWYYLVILAFGLIVGEWVLYQRRIVG